MSFNMKGPNWALVVCITILIVTAGCERDLQIKIDGKNPPTFSLSGTGNVFFLYVAEVHDSRPPSPEDPEIWKIRPNNSDKISKLPNITYGIVPNGFIQLVPASGPPPPLIEGRVYAFGGPAYNANGGSIWFTIQSGKSVQVTKAERSPK